MIPRRTALALLCLAGSAVGPAAEERQPAQLGPRPFYLVDDMDEGALKEAMKACESGPFYRTDFSIAHRGAPLQFPEHTRESYLAAARMGAGIIECDVAFTADRELVCRHSQCDLHMTTNILVTDLADQCSAPFSPADPATDRPASARCCTSDITLAEFRQLEGRMEGANEMATTPADYIGGTPDWRTELYAHSGTLMSHADSIALFQELGVEMTPELKSPEVPMPFDGDYTQQDYARQLTEEYRAAGVDPSRVFVQSFDLDDIHFWIENAPEFGRQAVWLDGRYAGAGLRAADPEDYEPTFAELAERGVRIIAPPLFMLVEAGDDGRPVPSAYALAAKEAGLDIITWSLERSGPLTDGGGWFYQTIETITDNDGDVYNLLHVLAEDIGVLGVFSDWPATTTYYANCMDID